MTKGLLALIQAAAPLVSVSEDKLPRTSKQAYPAVVFHIYGRTQDYQSDGPVGVTERQFQLDVYGNTAAQKSQIADALVAQLDGYVGTLTDGTVVQATYIEREQDMPFMSDAANDTGNAFRRILGFRAIVART